MSEEEGDFVLRDLWADAFIGAIPPITLPSKHDLAVTVFALISRLGLPFVAWRVSSVFKNTEELGDRSSDVTDFEQETGEGSSAEVWNNRNSGCEGAQ